MGEWKNRRMEKSFRDLEIWQLAHKLAAEVYGVCRNFPERENFGLTSQIQRSAVSVPANIAESCGRYRQGDKLQLLIIARGSLYETRSHLSIALDLKYITEREFQILDGKYEILLKQLNAFIKYKRNTT
ncbi:four helix bundle protein [Candidatus Uhrbacteria bacterium]|nr:four helix bundle protein [Candidatus Uhrbacteria bacterium]